MYMDQLSQRVESTISTTLPSSFLLVLNGWTSSARHYMMVFAVYADASTPASIDLLGSSSLHEDRECKDRGFVPLVFSPMEDEKDFSPQSLFNLVPDTLSGYGKPRKSVTFMVGDNCSVNQCVGRRESVIPLIGCASHRFNLCMHDFLESEKPLVAKVHALMRKLNTIKGRARLRKISDLAPVLHNDTRWLSTCGETTAKKDTLQSC